MQSDPPDRRQPAGPPALWKRIAALVAFLVVALAIGFLFMVVIPGR